MPWKLPHRRQAERENFDYDLLDLSKIFHLVAADERSMPSEREQWLESIDLMKYWKEFVIVDCWVSPARPPSLPPFILTRATAIDRILQKFIASLGRKLQSLSILLSLIGDPLSSRINRALSRRKTDTWGRDVASFYLFARRVYRIFFLLTLSFRSFAFFCSSEKPR